MSHSDMTIEVIKACGERVCVFGNIGNYPAMVVQMPPDEAQCAPIDPPAGDDLHHPSGRPLTYDELSGGY